MNHSAVQSSMSSERTEHIQNVRRSLNFSIPEEAWTDYTECDFDERKALHPPLPFSRLYCSFSLNGVGFHCVAIEVEISAEGLFKATEEAWEEELSALYVAYGYEGILQHMTISSRHYAVFAYPFNR